MRPSKNDPQSYWLYPGLLLIAYLPHGVSRGFHNAEVFKVLELPIDGVVPLQDIETNEFFEVPLEFLRHNLRLAFAFTNVGCQGRNLGNVADLDVPERGLTVWDTDTKYFRLAHLLTGTSRSRSGDLLQVV